MQSPLPPPPSSKKTPSFLQKLLEEGTEDFYKEDCPECGEENTFVKHPDYLFEIPEKKFSKILDVWVCSECGYEALEDEAMESLMNDMEKHDGNTYVKINVKNGNPIRITLH